jgi:dsRNA-specific ribonuclease
LEAYLSHKKDSIVSNYRLCSESIKNGLDRFILLKSFTGLKWKPLYVDEILQEDLKESNARRRIAAKTMADVVESILGAAHIDGGMDKALKCLSIFLPGLRWHDLESAAKTINRIYRDDRKLPPNLVKLEKLIGYTFKKKSILIESMTHGSFHLRDETMSLERLEFAGDALLDLIVVNKLFSIEPPLSHQNMHLLKTALVNCDFIGFLALEFKLTEDQIDVNSDEEIEESEFQLPLWKFLRHGSRPLSLEQEGMQERHLDLRDKILSVLRRGDSYPWALFSRLRVRKFNSDMVESLLAAIWVDSGSLRMCEKLVEKLGVMSYLERILRDDIHLLHPKEELGHLAGNDGVKYEPYFNDTEEGGREWFCKVFIGGRCISEVSEGVSKDEVKTKAAEAAVRKLNRERGKKGGKK